jgi:ribosome biogenesis GTPase A
VLDARDPIGTRSSLVEARMKDKTKCHKHLIFVLNKCATARAIGLGGG